MIHHLNHGTADGLACYIDNAEVLTIEEIARLDGIDRRARKVVSAQGLRETHALRPALHPAFASGFSVSPCVDTIARARSMVGPFICPRFFFHPDGPCSHV